MAKKLRIGILLGTFDPVHNAEIAAGLSILNTRNLDCLLLFPADMLCGQKCSAPAEDRWKMLVSACASDSRLIPFHPDLPDSALTWPDIFSAVKKEYPDARLTYLACMDDFIRFSQHSGFTDILSDYPFIIITGKSSSPSSLGILFPSAFHRHVETVFVDSFSSGEIRQELPSGTLPENLDVSVKEYCACKGLYGFSTKMERIDQWMDGLFSSLKPKRFAHSLSVAFTAKRLAVMHGLDPLKAEQAGLLHDCAKCLPLSEMQKIASEHSLTTDKTFLDSGALLHSIVGAFVAQDQYGMQDSEILDAIRYHNTGFPGMTRLAMCVCLSDSIEPLRQNYSGLQQIRKMAEVSLERALLLSLETTAGYVTGHGKYLHPRTMNTILWLKSLPGIKHD